MYSKPPIPPVEPPASEGGVRARFERGEEPLRDGVALTAIALGAHRPLDAGIIGRLAWRRTTRAVIPGRRTGSGPAGTDDAERAS